MNQKCILNKKHLSRKMVDKAEMIKNKDIAKL